MKKPTPAQLAARARFAEMARSGAFKRKAKAAKKAKANPRKKTVSQKISQLVREGYPQKQAVAVALSEQRAGKVKRNPVKRGRAPSIKVGDYVRSYDFPGMHDDHYLEGVVTGAGGGTYSIAVSRRVVGGEEKSIPASLRQIRAPMGPHFMTGVYGVQKLTRMPNPATGRKGSGTKLNPAAKPTERTVYQVQHSKDGKTWDRWMTVMYLPMAKQIAERLAAERPKEFVRVESFKMLM